MKWTDTTSYSRDENPKVPRVWSAVAGVFRVTVTNGHIHYPGEWVMHIHPGVVDSRDMQLPAQTPLKDVQKVAEALFVNLLDRALTEARR